MVLPSDRQKMPVNCHQTHRASKGRSGGDNRVDNQVTPTLSEILYEEDPEGSTD